MSDRLYFSRRRMLNRLSFDGRRARDLMDPSTGQSHWHAHQCLASLQELGYAHYCNGLWSITDAGVIAAAENGVIYAEGAGR